MEEGVPLSLAPMAPPKSAYYNDSAVWKDRSFA